MKYYLIFILTFVFKISTPQNFNESLSYKSYNTTNGLSQLQVVNIVKSSIGHIYIMTRNGINRYDGKNMKTYLFQNQTIYCTDYFEFENKNYFLGKKYFFVIERDSVKSIDIAKNFKYTNYFHAFFIEKDSTGVFLRIYIDSECYIYYYNIKKNLYYLKMKMPKGEDVFKIKKGKIWTFNHTKHKDCFEIYYYDHFKKMNSKKYSKSLNINFNSNINCFYQLKNSTSNEIYRLDIDRNMINFHLVQVPFVVKPNSILYESNNNLLINNGELECIVYDFERYWRVKDLYHVNSFLKDLNGNFFIGSERGLFIYNFNSVFEYTITRQFKKIDFWSFSKIDKDNYIAGSWGDGFFRINMRQRKISRLNSGEKVQRAGFGCLKNKANEIFMAHGATDKLLLYTKNSMKKLNLGKYEGEFYGSALASNGYDIFVGGYSTLYYYNYYRQKVSDILCFDTIPKTGKLLWMADYDTNSVLVKTNHDILRVFKNGSYEYLLKGINGFSLYYDKLEKTLWTANIGELLVAKKGKLNKMNQFPSKNVITSIDKYKNWLVVVTFGDIIFMDLDKYYRYGKEIYFTLSNKSDLNFLETNQNGIMVDTQEKAIFVNCSEKLYKIYPDLLIKHNLRLEKPQINNIQFYNNQEKVIFKSYQYNQHIDLDKKFRNMVIDFSAPVFNFHESLRYRYRVNNDEWIEVLNEEKIELNSLNSGCLQIQIQSSFDGQYWSDSEYSPVFCIGYFWFEIWWVWGIIILFLLLISFIIVRIYITKAKAQLKSKNDFLKLQFDLQNMEIQNLNQQLSPHDLKNILATVSAEIQVKAPESYRRFVKLLKLTVASLKTDTFLDKLSNQLQLIEDFLSIEKLQLGDKLQYQIINNLKTDIPLPRLLLKNMVENAIKHGIRTKDSGGEIQVLIDMDESCYIIKIKNNGSLIEYENNTHSGIGISTYQKLFELLNKKNSEQAKLKLLNLQNEVVAIIQIPIAYRYE